MNKRFKEDVVELLLLCSAMDLRDDYKSFNIDDICKLVKRFYPEDFFRTREVVFKISIKTLWAWYLSTYSFAKCVNNF